VARGVQGLWWSTLKLSKETTMDDDKKFSFFFLGLGLGVAVGVLFAPKSGEETRELIRDKANESKDYLRRRGEEFRETANEYVDRGKTALNRQRENLSAAVEAGKHAYRDATHPKDMPEGV
jgi:gas vesicle protein